MTKLTVEETNLLSIYKTGSRQGLIVAMNAALPFMDGEMRGFAARTLSKVEAMTEAEFAGLPIYAGRAAPAILETVSYWTTGTSAYVRSSCPIRFSASGLRLRCFPLISCSMRSFTKPGTGRNVPSAARPLRQALTASNTAPTAGSVSPADRPPSA